MSVILTVEDETIVSAFLGEILENAGYRVIAAANADEAIAILEARDGIRILITGINMPGSMDGLRLAAAVKDRWPRSESSSLAVSLSPGTTKCQGTVNSCQSRMRLMRFWLRSAGSNRDAHSGRSLS